MEISPPPGLSWQKSMLSSKLRLIFAGLLLSAAPAMGAPVTQLKVLSFNIWVQGGLSLSNCIQAIQISGADIVGLQECNSVTAGTIANSLGFSVFSGSDCSIVSRYPLSETIVAGNSRGVTVELSPGQRIHFFDCHLTAFPYGPYDLKHGQTVAYVTNQENSVRMPGLNQLLLAMQPAISSFEPCFLVGDFNAPSHLDYANVPWPTSIACVEAGLQDAYRQLHPTNRLFPPGFGYQDQGITWTPKTDQEPEGVFDRIDFVYFGSGDGVTPVTAVELDERNSVNPWPSDHRAVLVSFALTPPVATAKASLPGPGPGATNVSLSPTLTWLAGSNALSHTLYFGEATNLTLVTNLNNASFEMAGLKPGTLYSWRVDEITSNGTVTGDIWNFTTKFVQNSVYEWDFQNANLAPSLGNGVLAYADGTATSNLTSFGTSDGTTVPHMNGEPVHFLRAPVFSGVSNGYLATFTGSAPNGGGAYLNQYSMVFDFLLPGALNWFPFFNTDPSNSNDADFYVAPDGSIGIAAIGYSTIGLIVPNTWYRVAFCADLASGAVNYYLNGTNVFTGSAALDGRHALYSNSDPGPDLLLFNEGDASGNYTHAVYLSSFMFTDRTLSASEVNALGGPKARGILLPAPPLKIALQLSSTNLTLSWSGGQPPFQVQTSGNLPGAWQNLGPQTTNTLVNLGLPATNTFYRVLGQWP